MYTQYGLALSHYDIYYEFNLKKSVPNPEINIERATIADLQALVDFN